MHKGAQERVFLPQKHHCTGCIDDELAREVVPGQVIDFGITEKYDTTEL